MNKGHKILNIYSYVCIHPVGINDEECGIKPELEYGEMMGGRFFPEVEKKVLNKECRLHMLVSLADQTRTERVRSNSYTAFVPNTPKNLWGVSRC